jgi:multiple sugar transport system substrate-binding protein
MSDNNLSKKLSRRRFLQLAAGATTTTLLAIACAPIPVTVPPQQDAASKETEKEEIAAATAPEAPVDLRFSTIGWGGWLAEPWMAMIDKFNQSQSEATVVYEDIADGYAKVMAQAAGGVSADAYHFQTKEMFSFASRGFFLPLDELVMSSEVISKDVFFEDDWVETFFKDTQYLIPYNNNPTVIWYNTDLFDEAGVPYPPATYDDPAWGWDNFLEAAQKLTTGEGADRVFGWAGERWWVYALNWIWSNGGWVLNEEKTECVIDMPETVEALQWAADLSVKHKIQPTADQIIQGGNSAMFFGRRAAMAQKGTWWAIDLKAQEGLKWNVAPQPTGKAGSFARNPMAGLGIPQEAKHPEQSWQLLETLSQPEVLEIIIRAGQSVSRKEAMMSDVFLKQEPQDIHWDVFIQTLDGHTQRHPDTAIFPEMNDLLTPAWEAIVDGAGTVPEMVANVKGPINDLLSDCIEKGNCAA